MTYYYLYVILDVFSRAVVGWMIAEREDAALAEALIAETCAKEGIVPQQLTIHADRGSAMTSKAVAHLLADLGVTKTHSRPHVSNDNPFSEAAFKTHLSPKLSGSVWQSDRCACMGTAVLSLVQPHPSAQWHRVVESSNGACRSGKRAGCCASAGAGSGISGASRTLCARATNPAASPNSRVD